MPYLFSYWRFNFDLPPVKNMMRAMPKPVWPEWLAQKLGLRWLTISAEPLLFALWWILERIGSQGAYYPFTNQYSSGLGILSGIAFSSSDRRWSSIRSNVLSKNERKYFSHQEHRHMSNDLLWLWPWKLKNEELLHQVPTEHSTTCYTTTLN